MSNAHDVFYNEMEPHLDTLYAMANASDTSTSRGARSRPGDDAQGVSLHRPLHPWDECACMALSHPDQYVLQHPSRQEVSARVPRLRRCPYLWKSAPSSARSTRSPSMSTQRPSSIIRSLPTRCARRSSSFQSTIVSSFSWLTFRISHTRRSPRFSRFPSVR